MNSQVEKVQKSGVQLSERLASLGIIKDFLKHLKHHANVVSRGLMDIFSIDFKLK